MPELHPFAKPILGVFIETRKVKYEFLKKKATPEKEQKDPPPTTTAIINCPFLDVTSATTQQGAQIGVLRIDVFLFI